MPRFTDKRDVPYSAGQMWDLVADVDQYPKFLPWLVKARIRESSPTHQLCDMGVGFGPFRENFTSRNTLQRPDFIKVRYVSGPFRYLENDWSFVPLESGCRIEFRIDFEFRSRLLQAAIGVVFTEATRRMINAFLQRARVVYGPPPALNS
jgi:coenzyme Q-binding protein COQ10